MSFKIALDRHSLGIDGIYRDLDELYKIAGVIRERIKSGGKLLICGNGGSAGDAQHFAAELTGRFERDRKGIAGLALTTDTSALTAIGNDFGFDLIFARQIEALANSQDVVFIISTSGNSLNCVAAAEKSNEINCVTISLTGRDGGKLKGMTDYNFNIPLEWTRHIQEWHLFVIHCICEYLEAEL